MDKQILVDALERVPWYTDFTNFVVSDIILKNLYFHQKKKFVYDAKRYFWDEPYLFRHCANNIIRRCIWEIDMLSILESCHASLVGGHHAGDRMIRKMLQSEYYWPTLFKDAYEFVKRCD